MAKSPAPGRTVMSRVRFLGFSKSGPADACNIRITSVPIIPFSITFCHTVPSVVG